MQHQNSNHTSHAARAAHHFAALFLQDPGATADERKEALKLSDESAKFKREKWAEVVRFVPKGDYSEEEKWG